MSDAFSTLDYGEQLVIRYRASGLTRKEFAEQSGISVSTLAYYVRRERRASLPAGFTPNRIVPVDLVASDQMPFNQGAGSAFSSGVAIRLANGRTVELQRGFDAQLLGEVLAVLEAEGGGERA